MKNKSLSRLRTGVSGMLALLLSLGVQPGANAGDAGTAAPSAQAPPQIMQFGRLVGNWTITDESLQPDGSWKKGQGAQWNWYYILNGNAIQDDWIAPAPGVETPNNKRAYGTNIRIYNPTEARWEMAWASNNGGKVDTFTATAQGEDVVMRGVFGGADTRITFFDIGADRFSWKMEQRAADDQPFTEVYRIFGARQR